MADPEIRMLRTPNGVRYTFVSAETPKAALLVYLGGAAEKIFSEEGPAPAVRAALAAGFSVACTDLPGFGELSRPDCDGMRGFVRALADGRPVIEEFIDRARGVVDDALRVSGAPADRLFVAGTSRGGFFAVHLTAAEPRVRACVGFAPVTRWSALKEAADLGVADNPRLSAADVVALAPRLAGRPVGFWIGGDDERVGTANARAVIDALAGSAPEGSVPPLFVTADYSGHTVLEIWHAEAMAWLMRILDGREGRAAR